MEGAFEEPWISGRDRQRNEGILQRRSQGCVEPARGLEESNLALSDPTGVQLAPTSPKFAAAGFSKVRVIALGYPG
jgi:hypothetical protein